MMKSKVMTICAVVGLILAVSGVAQAALIQISVTGTAGSTEMEYTEGTSYTFNWTINDGYDGCSYDFFNSAVNSWQVSYTSDPLLWSDVSGDGLSGTYSRPSGSSGAPYDYICANSDGLDFKAYNDDKSTSSMGLTVNGVELRGLSVNNLTATGLNLDYSDTSFVNPATWAATYAGTYDSGVSESGFKVFDENYNETLFTASSFEIAAVSEPGGVVPEPGSVIIWLGLGTIGLSGWRRRRGRQKS